MDYGVFEALRPCANHVLFAIFAESISRQILDNFQLEHPVDNEEEEYSNKLQLKTSFLCIFCEEHVWNSKE